jgi:RHS repeat-associated protein
LVDVGNNIQNAANPVKQFRYDNWPGLPGSTKPSGLTNTLGRLVEVATSSGSLITDEWFSYTARGEISDVYASTPHSGGYYHSALTYWANGAPNVLTGAGGYYASYNVDGEGRPYQVFPSSGQTMVTNTSYNVAGLPTGVTYGSGDGDSFTYDPNTNRMTQYKFTVGSSPQSLVGNLTWNSNGTLQTQNISDPFNSTNTQNCSYSYDDLSRLASGTCGGAAAQTFAYDPFGNINKSGSPYSFQPSYSSLTNRMTSIGSFTPTYDSAGNVTNDSLHTYTWDLYGRPSTIDSVNLTYDALGRMVEQNRSGTYTQFVYAPTGQKMQIMNGQAPPVKSFVPLPAGGTAIYSATGVYYHHADHLGSSRLISTSNRTISYSGAYAPFGEPYAQSGTPDPSFTGQRQDTVAGLYDFPAREYSYQGRWSSPDPAGLAAVDPSNPQSWNRYAYVMNDPLDWVDPSGLDPCPNDNSWGAQLCRQAQAFRSTTFYNTWNPFSLVFTTGCSESGCVTTIDPNAFNLLLGLLHSSGNSSKPPAACKNGAGSGGIGVGAGYNFDAGVIAAGVSSTGGVNAGLFHNKAGGVFSGYSGGAAASGGVAVYAGSKVAGSPPQGNNVAFVLGGYAGVGPNITFTNAASVQQTSGPFTTASFNAGLGIANLGVQISFGGGIWQLSITPPLVSVGFGLAGSVITTNTITTQTGCK